MDYKKWCKRCANYDFDLKKGIICGLTKNKPDFQDSCKDFALDEVKNLETKTDRHEISGRTEEAAKKGNGCVGWLIWIVILIIINIILQASGSDWIVY
ncbi:hypothetical protein JW948_10755 [bacterium]|nr:hypothetical protein [bacterium]